MKSITQRTRVNTVAIITPEAVVLLGTVKPGAYPQRLVTFVTTIVVAVTLVTWIDTHVVIAGEGRVHAVFVVWEPWKAVTLI